MIDLSLLQAPDVVEELEYETIRAALLSDLVARDPAFTALVESDPAVKVLEVAAYRELLLRQRVNDAARQCLLAFATGTNLEHLAAFHALARLLVDPGDPEAIPPLEPLYESDTALRARVQLAPEGLSVAGPTGAYEFHARSASGQVADVDVASPAAGEILVTVLSTEGDGVPDAALLDTVTAALSARDVRPLTDAVTVQAASLVEWSLAAVLHLYDGPDPEVVRQAAEGAATTYAAEHHRLGHDITLSGLYAALHRPGVQRVELTSPLADVMISNTQAPRCTALGVTVGASGE